MKSAIPIGLLLAALVTLASLQYQWIGQISLVEHQKLRANLANSSRRFAMDFAAERERLYGALESRYRNTRDLSTLLARHREWSQSTQHPGLVKALYVADSEVSNQTDVRLRQVHVEKGTAEPVQWPGDLRNLEMALVRELDPPRRRFGPTPFRYRPNPGEAMVLVTAMTGPFVSQEDRLNQRSDAQSATPRDSVSRRPNGWVIARLDRSVMTNEILPALANRHFPRSEGQSYRLAVVDIDDNMKQVYATPDSWNAADLKSYDHAIDLFGSSNFRQPLRVRAANSGPAVITPERQFEVPGLQHVDAPLGHQWRLLVKNEAGSLEAAVEQLRLRNVAVSFGVFLVLAAAAFMLVFSARRTRALGKLHMEFAAGVSHELRTPLAVIRSAAYNLRSGVVRDWKNVAQYGAIVQKEERRLSGMVEQLMAFAETQAGHRRYDITAVDVTDVVDQALKALVLGDDVEVKVDRRIPADLPPALSDSAALSQCLQNLISNAVKYGRRGAIVELDIEASANPVNQTIRLAVMDRGRGVPAEDVPHLFDAFYRGSQVSPAIPGNGIGLHLVRKIIESQKGKVAYEDRSGGGAVFILIIPSAVVISSESAVSQV